jgi:hypothetical protein
MIVSMHVMNIYLMQSSKVPIKNLPLAKERGHLEKENRSIKYIFKLSTGIVSKK